MLLTAYEISILNTEFSPWSFSSSISSHQQIDCKPEKVNRKFTRALSEIHFLKERKLKYQRNQKAQQTKFTCDNKRFTPEIDYKAEVGWYQV